MELHRAFQALTNETVSLSGSNKDDSSSSSRQTWADKHDLGNKVYQDRYKSLDECLTKETLNLGFQ